MQRIGAWKATTNNKAFVQFLLPTSGYRDLYILSNLATTTTDSDVRVTFNNDPHTNGLYSANFLNQNNTNGTAFRINQGGSNYFTDMEGFIPAFLGNEPKHLVVKSGANIAGLLDVGVVEWNSTAALTTVRFSLNAGGAFATGSTISLYAI